MKKWLKAYFDSLDERSRRAVRFGVIAIVLIAIYLGIALPIFENWLSVRDELKTYQLRLETVSGRTPGSKAKIAGLFQTVPLMELPENEDAQRKLFWDKTYDQLKKAGVNISSGPSYVASAKKKTALGQGTLRLKFSGNCKYEQLLKFFAGLNENAYLVSIEEFSIKSNEKEPEKVTFEMVIGTFFK